LSIPANALGVDTPITVAPTTAPAGYVVASAAYQFGPSGTTFAQPVAVTIPLSAPTPGAHIFWSNASGGFDDVGGTVSGLTVTANVSHFSIGFCAVPASDGGANDVPADVSTGGDGGQSGAAGAGGAGAGGATGSGGGGGGTGGSTDAGAPPDAASNDALASLCTTMGLNLPFAKVTLVEAGAAPDVSTYTGGALVSGKHYLTAVSHYGGGQFTGSTQAVYTIDATAGTIQIGQFAGNGSSFIGMTYTNVDAHTLQVTVVCHTGSATPPGPQLYYTVSGSALTMTTVGSSDVLTIGPP
jgi:hypothetical protein